MEQKCKCKTYVKTILNRSDRSLIAKFRCGILQLHVETGRFYQTKLEDRTCKVCNDGSLEDELHFLCLCQKYSEDRRKMYNQAKNRVINFENLDTESKFKALMTNCSRIVANFLKKAWETRKRVLYK